MCNPCKVEAGWRYWWPRSLKHQLLTCRWIIALEPPVVDDPREVIADQRMETPGNRQEDAAIGRYRRQAIQQIGHRRAAGVAGMHPLNRLLQLHRITHQHDVARGRAG